MDQNLIHITLSKGKGSAIRFLMKRAGLLLSLILLAGFVTVINAQCPSIAIQPSSQADCDGNQVKFTATINPGVAPYTYTWYYKRPSDPAFTILSATTGNTSPVSELTVLTIGNANAPDGTQYYLEITDANLCAVITNIVSLTVNHIKGISPSAQNTTICQGGSYTLTANTNGTVVSYQWLQNGTPIPGATGSTLNITNATTANNGAYKVLITFNLVDGSGITKTCHRTSGLTRNLTVVTPSITGQSSVCANSTGNIYTTESGNSNYIWSVTGGTITAGGGSGDNTVTITWGAAGAGTINVNYTYSTGCTPATAASFPVTINSLPAIFNVTGGGSYCAGTSGIPIGLSGSQSGVSYQLLNGFAPVGSPVAGTGGAISFGLQAAAGNYTVVAVNNTSTCNSTMNGTAVININPKPDPIIIYHN